MRIKINELSLKNFLSFGNNWSNFSFNEGVNLITGWDYDLKRSNGSGKSSLLMGIPFALFGRIPKDINKNQIINWQNGKNCEVNLEFKKGESTYLFKRGIKPDKFEVYQNGNPLPIEKDIRVFQKEIEEDLLEIDYKLFTQILFYNLDSTSLIDAKKDAKRKLIEKAFNQEVFSRMNDRVNEKLKNIKTSIEKTDVEISLYQEKEKELQNEISKLQIPDIFEYQKKYDDIKQEYDNLKYSLDEINSNLQTIENNEEQLEEERSNLFKESNDIHSSLSSLEARKNQLEETNKEKQEELSNYKNSLENLRSKLESYQEDYSSQIQSLEDQKIQIEENINNLKADLTSKRNELNNLPNIDDFKNNTICPKCHSEVSYENIKSYVDQKVNNLTNEINEINEKFNKKNEEKKEIDSSLKNLKETEQEKQKIIDKINNIPDLQSIESQINFNQKEIDKIKDDIQEKKNDIEKLNKDLEEKNKQITKNKEEKRKWNEEKEKVKDVIHRLEMAKKEKDNAEKEKNKIENEIQEKRDKLTETRNHLKSLDKERKKYISGRDYYEYFKTLLKDEHIKQYALSSFIPYLNAKSNEYITEAGFNFFLQLDNWMNIDINGPGIGKNYSIKNFSNGELKSVDFSLKFAIMDCVRSQSNSCSDLLVLDEIADTSIDSVGLEGIMNMIKYRQKVDNLKLYMISHNSDISAMSNFDDVHLVNKEEGFSKI